MKKIILLSLFLLIALPIATNASVLQDPSFFPEKSTDYNKSCIADGSCSLDQGFNTFVVLTKWAMGILGSISLLFFIIGGFMWLISGGKADQIAKGKSIMINTVIGIIIVLAAWLIVQTVLTSISKRNLNDTLNNIPDAYCSGQDNGVLCRNNLGICNNERCVQKCDATPPDGGGYGCREFTNCANGTIVQNMCFGPNNIVCCQFGESN